MPQQGRPSSSGNTGEKYCYKSKTKRHPGIVLRMPQQRSLGYFPRILERTQVSLHAWQTIDSSAHASALVDPERSGIIPNLGTPAKTYSALQTQYKFIPCLVRLCQLNYFLLQQAIPSVFPEIPTRTKIKSDKHGYPMQCGSLSRSPLAPAYLVVYYTPHSWNDSFTSHVDLPVLRYRYLSFSVARTIPASTARDLNTSL